MSLCASPLQAAERLTLSGHVPQQVRTAAKLERAPADEPVRLSLIVRLDQDLLDQTLAGLYGPNAPGDRRYLSSAEFARKFGLADKRQKLKDFARANGLSVDPREDRPDSMMVRVLGPASLVERAFNVQLNHYRDLSGRVFRAHETEPQIPASLAPHLGAVAGLSNVAGALKPHYRTPKRPLSAPAPRGSPGTLGPRIFPGSGPNSTLTPSDIKTIYGLSGGLNGSGQNVAILELDGYNPADITLYETQYGLASPPLNFISIDGAQNLCGPFRSDPCNATTLQGGQPDEGGIPDFGMLEVVLDIEMVAALAPGSAGLLIYTGPNTFQGGLDAYDQIAVDDTAQTVSTSYGIDEQDGGSSLMQSESQIFQRMATQGQTIYAASGDNGAYDMGGNTTLGVDDPAAQPFVSGVGGTSLAGTLASHTETVWNDGFLGTDGQPCNGSNQPCAFSAGGGGVANFVSGSFTFWPLPNYQSGVPGTASQQFRNVPDVALNADVQNSPYSICVGGSCNCCFNPGPGFCHNACVTSIGGTSAAAPLWAGLTALIDQQRASLNVGSVPLGFANPTWYQLGTGPSYGSVFNDITSGTNGNPGGPYLAGVGYDDASGWGSFQGNALINILNLPGPVSNMTSTTLGVSSIAWTWSSAFLASSYNIYNGTTSPAQFLANVAGTQYTRTGLPADSTESIIVKGLNAVGEGGGVTSPSTSTLALPLSGAAVAVFITSVTATYTPLPASPQSASCFGYVLQASIAPDFSGAVLSVATANEAQGQLTLTGLSAGQRYYLRLGTLNNLGGTDFIFLGPTIPTPAPFSNITPTQIQANWTAVNQPGFQYLAEASTTSNFLPPVLSSQTANQYAIFGTPAPLIPNTTYFFQVSALGGPFVSLGSTSTLAAAPAPASPPFAAVFNTSMTVTWLPNGNPVSMTTYTVVLTSGSLFPNGFAGNVAQTSAFPGPAPSATLAGLTANTTYFLFVAATNNNGIQTPFTAMGSSPTLTNSPGPASFTAVFETSATVSWGSGGNSVNTLFAAQVSSVADFSSGVFSQTSQSLSFTPTGLLTNTTYYAQVFALNFAGAPSFPVTASSSTLTLPPGPTANPFVTVTTSITVQWVPLALSPQAATCEGYRVDASTAADFSGQLVSNATLNPSASELGVSGLLFGTTYYVRVGALNWDSVASYLVLGATQTTIGCISSGTVTNQAPLVLSVCTRFPQLTFIQMQVPLSALPTGTGVSMAVNDSFFITTQNSNEAVLTPLGSNVDFEVLTTGQLQPAVPVPFILTYNPAALPGGFDPATIELARFVDSENQWSLLPTTVDTAAHSIQASTLHLSFFAPFFVTPASALSSVQIFPVPWEPGSGDPNFDAPKLTFSNLPANTKVRLYTILGESVWSADATPGGVLFWDGNNKHGGRVGTGTYLAVIEGGGSRRVLRVVIIR